MDVYVYKIDDPGNGLENRMMMEDVKVIIYLCNQ